jgi:hypothetical protein
MFTRRYYQNPKNQKTYGRFSGTIFFEGVRGPQVSPPQRLARQKITKKRKTTRKNAIFLTPPPGFSAKEAHFGAIFYCQTF